MKIKEKTSWYLKDFKTKEQTKAIEDKPDHMPLMQKKCFNRLLDKRMDDIKKISKKKMILTV